jgi:hypothetical protein
MDIQVNKDLYNALVLHNSKLDKNFGNTVLQLAPTNKKYPYTIFSTIRDTSIDNNCYGKRSNKGYRLDIYAQDKGTKYNRLEIAEHIAQSLDKFMSLIGLERVSYNAFDVENEGTTYHIIITYSATLDEYRRKFI